MKAFIVDHYGRKDGLRFGEMPDDDVLVQIHAASVNQLNSKIRDGEFKLILPYSLPLILGNDVAGVVVRVGSKALRFKPGDEVYARPRPHFRVPQVAMACRCRRKHPLLRDRKRCRGPLSICGFSRRQFGSHPRKVLSHQDFTVKSCPIKTEGVGQVAIDK
jgi:threonine dehydrogenase-like Zn-dependent dehydrogenase